MASMTSVFADWSNSTSGYCIFSYDGSTTSVTINLSGGPGSITNVNVPGGTCDFIGLSPSTTYTASCTANPFGNTLSSSFTTPSGGGGGPALPGNVTGLVATPNYPPLYTHLSWNAASGATSYEIHYGRTDGSYDKVINTGSTSTTSDIFDVQKGKQFYFFVYGVNATGRSVSASNVEHAVAGPGRPNDFDWTYTTVSAGSPAIIDHRDWNLLAAKINAFRDYYPDAELPPYGFTTASAGDFQAFYYRQAVTAINDMSPFISLPPLHYTGDDFLAADFSRLRISLNSIP